LKRVFFAGEVFPTKHLNMWRRALPHATFVNLYGPIEITVDCTYYIFDREFNDDSPIPIGFPCRNSDVLIIDEDDKLINDSRIGELCVRGSSLAMGYYNNPEQTSKAFVQNPLNRNYPELIYRTGDLVHRNEFGEIMFDGRKDFQIKHLGYRIELAEIENAVLAIEEIRNACVLYHREKKAITLVFEATDSLTVKSIRTVLQNRLPKYMLPTAFFEVSEMPRNPNGKIDRQQLATQYTS
jgi:acyl-coenzyme A synthetase/AMP-(fatty) acid ligase